MMFYKETEFQDTPIGRMPKDWNFNKLENMCEKVKAGGTPLTSVRDYWNGNIPFVKIEDLTTSGKYLVKTQSFISKDGLANSSAWIVPENSLLLAMYGSMGEASINKIPVATNQAIIGIIPKNREDVHFLYYWYLFFKPNWKRYAKPTTQANLTAKIIRSSLIPLPPEKERKAIVGVLGVVDSAVELVDKVIAKTERLKKGLMQTLLTRGIGHKEYKQTPIGKIPKTWEVKELGKLAFITKLAGFEFTKFFKYNKKGEIIALRGVNIKDQKLDLSNVKRISKEISDSLPRSKVHKNDIVFSYVGTIGEVAIINESNKFHLGPNVAKISIIKKDSLSPLFLMYTLKSASVTNQINATASLTAQASFAMNKIRKLKIPIPPVPEQNLITNHLSIIDRKLELEKMEKSRLERIKRGLMDLLLTGKIRVKVD